MAASNDTLTFYFRFEAEPRLQTTVRQLGLDSSIRHTQRWLKLIIQHGRFDQLLEYSVYPEDRSSCRLTFIWTVCVESEKFERYGPNLIHLDADLAFRHNYHTSFILTKHVL